jgi:hypothetical protein
MVKRARRQDENGWLRNTRAKRQPTSVCHTNDDGSSSSPLVALMLPDTRTQVYRFLDENDMRAFARTCRGMWREFMNPRTGLKWVPVEWRAAIHAQFTAESRLASRAVIEQVLRPAGLLRHVPALGENARLSVQAIMTNGTRAPLLGTWVKLWWRRSYHGLLLPPLTFQVQAGSHTITGGPTSQEVGRLVVTLRTHMLDSSS